MGLAVTGTLYWAGRVNVLSHASIFLHHHEGKHSSVCPSSVNLLSHDYVLTQGPPERFQRLCGPRGEAVLWK